MEVEDPIVTSKGDGKTHQGDAKVMTFLGTILDSSLGPDCFLDDGEDQVSSLPPSWYGPEVMSFFRYAAVFSDDMEIDPATAEVKFVPDWDVRNKDSVMDELTARMFLFNINTPLDRARSRKMKSQDLGAAILLNQAQSNVYVNELYRRWVEAASVRGDLEKETIALKRKIQCTPDAEKKLAQLSQDLQAQQEKVKSLMTQNQSSQAAAASASEERDKIAAKLKSFVESSKEKGKEHKEVLSKMEEAVSNARAAYERMLAEGGRPASNQGVAFDRGAQLFAKIIHKGPEMTVAVPVVNNSMSAIGFNSGVQGRYIHALKKMTPYRKVPLINRNAEAELRIAIACFDSLTFPVVNDLPNLVNEPLLKIKDALFFAGGASAKE
ncbi:hypothetical protein Hdeb2414_s0001g00009541 [Helianthus debilis subsp. tardiflorus]